MKKKIKLSEYFLLISRKNTVFYFALSFSFLISALLIFNYYSKVTRIDNVLINSMDSIGRFFQIGDWDLSLGFSKSIVDSKSLDYLQVELDEGPSLIEVGAKNSFSICRNLDKGSVKTKGCVFIINTESIILYLVFLVAFLILFFVTLKVLQSNLTKAYTSLSSEIDELADIAINDDFNHIENNSEILEVYKTKAVVLNLLNEVVSNRQQKDRYKLARQIAHDIRGPLSLLRAVGETVDNELLKEKLLKSTNRISDICSSLLSEKNKGECLPLIPHIYIKEVVDEFTQNSKLIGDRKINYKWSSQIITVMFNRVEFKNIIRNMIMNAIEATTSTGIIKVYDNFDGNNFNVVISDNGQGMKPAIMARIFDEGFSYGKDSGYGLGLFSANIILKKWNCEIFVDSEPQKGTEFVIMMPVEKLSPIVSQKLHISKDVYILDDSLEFVSEFKQFLNSKIKITHFSTYDQFLSSISDLSTNLVFIDNDLGIDSELTGIDIIIKHKLFKDVYLLTNSFDDPEILKTAMIHNISIIPKDYYEKIIDINV